MNCMRRLALLTTAAFLLLAAQAGAQSVQLVPFGGQTYASPYHVAGEPGNPSRVYVVEAAGQIRVVVNGVTQGGSFLDINTDVFDGGEGGCECGMFSMALAPDFATSGLFYVFYTRNTAAQHDLVIREFRRTTNLNDVDESTGRDVVVINHPVGSDNHNGGQLQFGPDGLLYISTGDGGGTPQNGQSVTTLLGKILRINPADPPGAPAYSIPADNPFADGVGVGNADEIYSYGLRNPYRFSFDRLTGDLIIGDVGQSSWEEIDFVSVGGGRGANFGWRCYEGMHVLTTSGECNPLPANHTPPVHEYPNVTSAAINGGFVVRDTALPTLLGRYLYADSSGAFPEIRSITLSPGTSSGDSDTGMTGGTSSFGEDACGHIYVAKFDGTVSRIEPTSGGFPCAPQLAPPSSPQVIDGKPPALSVDVRRGKRAGARGELILLVGCDESCAVQGGGEIVLRGRDLGLDPGTLVALAPGVQGVLHLDLSRRESRHLLARLRDGAKAKAVVDLSASDAAGNQSTATRRIKQKR
jgi:glucose/arabinose dehydrogenase